MSPTATEDRKLGASFRDPSGFLFTAGGQLYRQVNQAYREEYQRLLDSGLYQELVEKRLLIPHEEADVPAAEPALAYKVIRPERVPFISYPYEWSFSQYQDAALATLEIQKRALARGMSLKDASAYNIQFYQGKPVLIDTLSFETYQEGQPWVAYRQFCQHFLAPLALMALVDVRLSQWMRVSIDGVPLDLASQLLPWKTRLSFALGMHIHTHARSQQKHAASADRGAGAMRGKMSKVAFQGLIDSLESAVRSLAWEPGGTEWGDYYQDTNYSDTALEHKQTLVAEYIDAAQPQSVWDLGANTGVFSRIASERGIPTVAFDIDPTAVERGYREVKQHGEKLLLPLLQDLTNPSADLGWHNRERSSLLGRGPADLVLALALIHHLAISNNVPFDRLADFFAGAGRWLVIEFVPKSDSQVRRLLSTRQDIFPDYDFETFEEVFSTRFKIHRCEAVQDSERRLYLMERLTG